MLFFCLFEKNIYIVFFLIKYYSYEIKLEKCYVYGINK